MSEGLTAEKIQAFMDKAIKQITADAGAPDVVWIMKSQIRTFAKYGPIREDLQKILDDPEIPENAMLQVLK